MGERGGGGGRGGRGREAMGSAAEGQGMFGPGVLRNWGISYMDTEVSQDEARELRMGLMREGVISADQATNPRQWDESQLTDAVRRGNLTEREIVVLVSSTGGGTPGYIWRLMNRVGRREDVPAVLRAAGVPYARWPRRELDYYGITG